MQDEINADVRKEADSHLITVKDSVDKPTWRAAMERAAEAEGFDSYRDHDAPGFTFEKVREFADSTMFVVWRTDQYPQ
jgi:hypothetical protein